MNIKDILSCRSFEVLDDSDIDIDMYILTNETSSNGASTILNDGALRYISELFDDDICIIPSSVHEVILMPYSKYYHNSLPDVIEMVNREQLKLEDILSDHAYMYDRAENSIFSC